jgi:phage shock protein A
MFSTLMAIARGRANRARDDLENSNATVILEQKIREAQCGHDKAKRALATLILREKNETRALSALKARIDDLEGRTREALSSGMEDLAQEAANALAELETEKCARDKALKRTGFSGQRLRLMIEKCQRRLMELQQGLIAARSLDDERVSARSMQGDIAGVAALVEGEAVLDRLLNRPDSVDEMEVLDQLNAELNGDDLVERLSEHGLGAPVRSRGEDVLDRLRAGITPHKTD